MAKKPTYEELEKAFNDRTSLKEQKKILSLAVEQISEGLAIVDLDGNLEFANNAFVKMHGYSPYEVIGKNLSIFHTPEQMPSVEAANLELKQTGSFMGEIWHAKRDGTVFPTMMQNSLITDETGNPIAMLGTIRDISDYKQAKEDLKRQEKEIRIITDNVPALVSYLDTEGRYRFVNKQYEKWFGIPPSEIIGRHYKSILGKDTYEQIRGYVDLALSGQPVSYENALPYIKGGTRWVVAEYIPDMNQDGKVEGIFALVTDITKRKQTEEELRESEDKYREFVEGTDDFIAQVDSEGRLTYLNKKAAKVFGLSIEECIGSYAFDFIHPDEREKTKTAFDAWIRDRISKTTFENRQVNQKTGEVFHMHWTINFHYDKAGDITGINSIARDITERKQFEESLRQSKKQYQELVENLNDVIYSVDTDGMITYVSPPVEAILGYTPDELTGIHFKNLIHPDDRDFIFRAFEDVLQEKIYPSEYRIRTKDGGYRWVRTSSRPVRAEGRVTGLQGVLTDITDRKQAEEALRESEEKYRQLFKNASIGIGIANQNGEIIDFNDAILKSGGYSRKDISKINNIAELYYNPKDRSRILELVQTQGSVDEVEVQFKRKDGTPYDTLLSLRSIKFKDEPFLQAMVQDITERKQIEGALRESESLLKATFESTADGILVVDEKGQVVHSNKRFAKMWRIPNDLIELGDDEKLLGHVLEQLVEPEAFLSKVQKLYKTLEKDFDTLVFKDGRVFERYSRPLIRAGEIAGRVWSFRDVTERNKAKEELIESEQKYRDLFENIYDIYYRTDPQGKITLISPSVERIFDFKPDELIGRELKDYYVDSQQREEFLSLIKSKGFIEDYEATLRHKDGTPIWVSTNAKLLKDDEGNFTGVEGTSRDITERKQAEEALRESESQFRNLFDLSPQAVALTDVKTGQLIDINDKFCELTQFAKEDLIGKTTTMAGFYSEEDRKIFINELQSSGHVDGLEMNFKAKDGSILTALMYAKVLNIAGKPLILTVFNDVTTQKQLEAKLRQSQKMEAIGTLAGGIAHEFNNILGIIIGNTELAIDDVPEWNPANDCLEEIRSASLRAKDVVRQIMSFARKTPANKKPIQVSTIISESLKLLRATIPKTIDIQEEILCEAEMILANPTEIHQVLINLCANSVHALENETGMLHVHLGAVHLDDDALVKYENLKPGNYVKLKVKDSGKGINPEIIDRVFDPYFTTKDVDQGLGMGLAVVHGIVKKHDGAITIISEVGKGTAVEVLFPIIEAEVEAEEIEPKLIAIGTERILFVDDEVSLVKMAKQTLERLGYQVFGKTDSIEALDLFRSKPDQFDLVITDMAMPHMAGDQLTKKVLNIRPDIPVILCTGHSERINEVIAKQLGITAYVMKPLERTNLIKIVRKVLDEAKG